jgi:VWFA-related protein
MVRHGRVWKVWRALCATVALAVTATSAALAAPPAQGAAPSVSVYGVESRDYPNVTAYVAVADTQGAPVVGLTAADVAITLDGQPLEGGPVTISSHAPSVAVALALDISVDFASFTEVQAAAREFVEAMGEDEQAAVVSYASDVEVVQDFTSDQAALLEAINGLTAAGTATNLNRAVSETVTQLAGVEAQRKAVVAITNGGDTVGAVPTATVTAQASDAGVLLYTMVFAPTVNVNALRAMAQDTGGRAFALDAAADVSDSLAAVAAGLRQGYSINFQSPLPADSGLHSLGLAVTVDDLTAEAEAEFEAVLIATPISLALSVAEGQQVLGIVNLTAQVASSTPITSVEYRLDGQPLAVLNTPPYSYQWDSSTVAAGLHILTARATDNAGTRR